VRTPLLEGASEKELEGNVYILQSNPPTLELLVAASGDGVNLKLVGVVHLNEATGQLTTTFTETPQVPFTSLKLSFENGPQGAVATPTSCGTYQTTSDFTPWATKAIPDAFPDSLFASSSGPEGAPCPSSPLPFNPTMSAGSSPQQAGAYTSFSLQLQNPAGRQRIEKLQVKMPPGLTASIANVPPCPEPQAQQGDCPASSQIGSATVAAGPGSFPLVIPQPGEPESPVYLTGPYQGAPFGLSIVTHPIAGPFDLEQGTPCDCIVTRARIEIDPHTAQVTATTDPLPQIIKGVPTDLRVISTTINRADFMINPTNCTPTTVTATATGTPPPGAPGTGTSTPLEAHFYTSGCQALQFTPKFTAVVSGKTSKADGASLTTTLSYPASTPGSQANLTYAKVTLPKQLPSRLTTLQKACLAKTFETNPATCPAASIVGHATVTTPLLPVPLTGPAYFVSHGGEEFPSLIIVLQGDNVTIDQTGNTLIRKGITTTTFKTIPDAPINTFTLTLPQGPYSALTANTNLCTTKNLTIPTQLTAQNNQQTTQNTKITLTGCPKKHKHTNTKKHHKHK
jgi:hypothetical protein